MKITPIRLAFGALLFGASAAHAQFQELRIFGNTSPTVGRFTFTPERTWNRIPGDQIGGATKVRQQRHWLVDVGPALSTEDITFLLGVDNGGLPSVVGSSGPFTITAAAGTIFRLDWGPGVTLPSPYPGCTTPTHDIWVGIEDHGVGAAQWPNNGLGWVFDGQEAPSAVRPYTVGNTFGLNFVEVPPGVAAPVPTADFTNFFHSVLVDADVLHGLAGDTGGIGFTSPNHGFASLVPDPGRGDQVGIRLGTKKPPGASAALIVSPFTLGAVATFQGIGGGLCLGPPFIFLGGLASPSAVPATGNPVILDAGQTPGFGNLGSEIIWGPVTPLPIPAGTVIHLQALTTTSGGTAPELSTMLTFHFP